MGTDGALVAVLADNRRTMPAHFKPRSEDSRHTRDRQLKNRRCHTTDYAPRNRETDYAPRNRETDYASRNRQTDYAPRNRETDYASRNREKRAVAWAEGECHSYGTTPAGLFQ